MLRTGRVYSVPYDIVESASSIWSEWSRWVQSSPAGLIGLVEREYSERGEAGRSVVGGSGEIAVVGSKAQEKKKLNTTVSEEKRHESEIKDQITRKIFAINPIPPRY